MGLTSITSAQQFLFKGLHWSSVIEYAPGLEGTSSFVVVAEGAANDEEAATRWTMSETAERRLSCMVLAGRLEEPRDTGVSMFSDS